MALLYLARPILVPVTLAVLLCFAISPLVLKLRAAGLGHASSVVSAVATTVLFIALLAVLIGLHVVQMADNLPSYRATFEKNLRSIHVTALSPMEKTWDTAERLLSPATPKSVVDREPTSNGVGVDDRNIPVLVEVLPPNISPTERIRRLLSWVWGPIGSAGIVVVVLVFLLLERESLRDRFIRLVGDGDLQATTSGINDAAERLSRYLGRQLVVNIGFGFVTWAALTAVGLPEAALLAVLSGVLRFIPYVGVLIAALCALLLALAAAEGWTLVLMTGALFVTVDLIVSHVIEPRVYGQATGLSPLSIVLATLFWGWLWGPIGVVIATPLTLCLAVAGRHAEALGFLDVVLGDGPALTMAQKFYQRALSGDAEEIIAGARSFIGRRSFAAYCDHVLVPALQLSRADFVRGRVSLRQQSELRGAIVQVVEALDGARRSQPAGYRRMSVLDEVSSGRALRQQRMLRQNTPRDELSQGVPVVVCVGLGGPGDDLATEILVRILRSQQVGARDLTVEDLRCSRYARDPSLSVNAVCLVTMTGGAGADANARFVHDLRSEFGGAEMLALLLPGFDEAPGQAHFGEGLERILTSYEQAVLEIQARVIGSQLTMSTDPRLDRS